MSISTLFSQNEFDLNCRSLNCTSLNTNEVGVDAIKTWSSTNAELGQITFKYTVNGICTVFTELPTAALANLGNYNGLKEIKVGREVSNVPNYNLTEFPLPRGTGVYRGVGYVQYTNGTVKIGQIRTEIVKVNPGNLGVFYTNISFKAIEGDVNQDIFPTGSTVGTIQNVTFSYPVE